MSAPAAPRATTRHEDRWIAYMARHADAFPESHIDGARIREEDLPRLLHASR